MSLGVFLAFGGCGIPVLDTPNPGLTVANIVDRIECEIAQSVQDHPNLKRQRWAAAADLYLTVNDSAGLTPTVSFLQPLISHPGTEFSFGASAALKGERTRIYNQSIVLALENFPVSKTNIPLDRAPCPQVETFDLAGDLGIKAVIDIGLGSLDTGDRAQFSTKDNNAFGQTIEFVVTKNVSGVGPMWTLVRFNGPGGLFGAERVDTHKLIISFAPGTTKAAAATGQTAVVRAQNQNSSMQFELLNRRPLTR
jgi:hypothetical protein